MTRSAFELKAARQFLTASYKFGRSRSDAPQAPPWVKPDVGPRRSRVKISRISAFPVQRRYSSATTIVTNARKSQSRPSAPHFVAASTA
ncbi:hypothetical protein KCP71_02455 [Salmonella enterica subsp. enterica]|nr:hypothetical protein KCP71_02455 [Salmonella enterica subsp. enterica]